MPKTISCPQCKYEFEVTEVLAAQLRAELQTEFEAKQNRTQNELEAKWERERALLSAQAFEKAKVQIALHFQDIQQQLTEARDNLKTAQQAELELRQERRRLQEQSEALELTVNRTLDAERANIRAAAKK